MFLFIRKVVAALILRMSSPIVRFLLAVIPVMVQVSMTRTTKHTPGGVLYRAVYGKWEVRYLMSDWGHSLSLSHRSAMTPTIGQSSSSMEITQEETGPRLPGV